MGRKIFALLTISVLFISLGCGTAGDIAAVAGTPEVIITSFTPVGWMAYDSTEIAVIDTIVFIVPNGVDAVLNGYYIDFFKPSGDSGSFLFSSGVYGIGMNLFAFTGEDTIENKLFGIPLIVDSAVTILYNDPNLASIRLRIHFYGEDAYGYHRKWDIYHDYAIVKANP